MKALLRTGDSWGPTLVRAALGVIFIAHGGQKVFGWFGGHGLAATVAGMGHMGIPAPLAYVAAFTDLLGGLGVLLGFLTRPASLGIAVVMTVAILKVHLANGFFMNWASKPGAGNGIEAPMAFLAMALSLLITGAGALSVDRRLSRDDKANQELNLALMGFGWGIRRR